MEVGQTSQATIYARVPWNDTKIDLVEGSLYRFTADGTWWDLVIRTDADGYPTKVWPQAYYESQRPVPDALWFCLVGVVKETDGPAFVIGRRNEIEASRSGRLFCCANDAPNFYFNNFGKVQLEVERIR
ncbi:hypothetical protein [Pseudomonas sp. PD9R]|uniref:hypothetical protein n=1 Tax=Pseudomonas sp. PD9R TaxID=2853534 RepID=UPI001C48F0AE|nr:hypothetical protein [Pseudomonas sp. PD9R]MBV6823562.1 hypothetical protein [Pseudomonas sp. PD9R]